MEPHRTRLPSVSLSLGGVSLALLVLLPCPAVDAQSLAPPPGGSLTGIVFDSTRGEPLEGAGVFLWGTRHQGVTDADGRFRIDGVSAGSYTVVFFHARLAALGVSAGPREVRVEAGRAAAVELGTPSMPTLLATQCALEDDVAAAGGGTVVGRVSDGATEVPLPGARVRLSWTEGERGPTHTLDVRSDDEGWFRACAVPTGVAVGAGATFLDRSARRQEFVVEEAEPARLRVPLRVLEPSFLSGRLVDAATGRGIAEAEVRLRGTDFRGVSSPEGAFHFESVPPGQYGLVVRHVAYGSRTDAVELDSGARTDVRVELSQTATELAPIEVTVEAQPLAERAMGGKLISREDIDPLRARARDVGDVLRNQQVAGLVVSRGADGVCVGFTPGQARMMWRSDCVPALVYIDNVRAADPVVAVSSVPVDAIDRMILYRPVEAGNLFGLGGGNGVLLIFTKSR